MTEAGLYCPAGDFHIDPWRSVPRAVITHAHSDHARWGMGAYLAVEASAPLLRSRLGADIRLQTLRYGESIQLGGARLSLHPAGHVLGSAQVRVEVEGRVWVVAGDYKLTPDPTCDIFEPVPCHVFVSESTFGLPIYRWAPPQHTFDQINAWWRRCQAENQTAVLLAYSLGKAQRLLAGVDATIGPITVHGAVHTLNEAYRAAGVALPDTLPWSDVNVAVGPRPLVIAPPSAADSPWLRRFGEVSTAFASGWMQVRGIRRRRALQQGFTLSDHADWPELLTAIDATGAEIVYVTHGYVASLVRYLHERGRDARPLDTAYGGDEAEEPESELANATATAPVHPSLA